MGDKASSSKAQKKPKAKRQLYSQEDLDEALRDVKE